MLEQVGDLWSSVCMNECSEFDSSLRQAYIIRRRAVRFVLVMFRLELIVHCCMSVKDKMSKTLELTMVYILASGPSCPGLVPNISKKFRGMNY